MKELIELVKKFEGFSPTPYVCPAGYLTIGYGHVLTPTEKEVLKVITREEAELLLERDLQKYLSQVSRLSPPLPPLCLFSLTSFTYNVGVFAYQRSTLRRKLLRAEYEDAANEFLKWVYAGGRVLPGLVKRRQAEREMFLKGISGIYESAHST